MGTAGPRFERRLTGFSVWGNFTLVLVQPDLSVNTTYNLAFARFAKFRDSLPTTRAAVELAGIPEANSARSWSELQPEVDEIGGRYLVLDVRWRIVGVFLVRFAGDAMVEYVPGTFLDADGDRREDVFERLLTWLWCAGIREFVATSSDSITESHLERCGFDRKGAQWRLELGHAVTLETSRRIYEDALVAYTNAQHPCHVFRGLQGDATDEQWQMPEPFAGARARREIVFFGLNPSYRAGEHEDRGPTRTASFYEWDLFYRTRYESSGGLTHPLYQRYQEIGAAAFRDDPIAFRLGRDAMVMEAVRFRSRGGEGCDRREVLAHESILTRQLLLEVRPRIIVAMSKVGIDAINMFITPQLDVDEGVETLSMRGPVAATLTGGGGVWVIPAVHLAGRNPIGPKTISRLVEQVRDASRRAP